MQLESLRGLVCPVTTGARSSVHLSQLSAMATATIIIIRMDIVIILPGLPIILSMPFLSPLPHHHCKNVRPPGGGAFCPRGVCYLQDQDSYSPGQVPGHASPDQGQDTMDPVDPGNVLHEDFESDSDVNRDRLSRRGFDS